MSVVVIYHGNCPDGVVAAWAFTRALSQTKEVTEFHPTTIRSLDLDTKMPNLQHKKIYIVDYSYSISDLKKIAAQATRVNLYDHHETAQKTLKSISPEMCNVVIDTKRCGAEITWDELHGSKTRPWFMKHIRDRDLWLWQNQDSKAFSAAFEKDGLTFETLDQYMQIDQKQIEQLYARGREILRGVDLMVEKLCETQTMQTLRMEKIPVVIVQSSLFTSEIGNQILMTHPLIHVALICHYSLPSCQWKVSLRSRPTDHPHHVNVAEMAAQYQGGGHPSAAGFSFSESLETLFL